MVASEAVEASMVALAANRNLWANHSHLVANRNLLATDMVILVLVEVVEVAPFWFGSVDQNLWGYIFLCYKILTDCAQSFTYYN